MKVITVTYFLILEYLLIIKHTIIYLFDSHPPKNWQSGDRGNTLLIPGLNGTFTSLKTIGNHMNKLGYKIHTINNLNMNDKIEKITDKLSEFILKNNLENFVIIAHSKGGLATRYLITHYPNIDKRIKKIFTIASPHHGSSWAYLIFSQRQLAPRSNLIKSLIINKNSEKMINIYPKVDNHVIPNRNLILEGANNIQLDVIGHTNILESQKTIAIIEKYL